jgi:holin-like protein
MQLINGITLLLIYQLAGEVSVRLLGLPVPGPVMGMVMLFITLMIRGQMAKAVEPACIALLGHLSLLFVPAGVGLIVHFNRLQCHPATQHHYHYGSHRSGDAVGHPADGQARTEP